MGKSKFLGLGHTIIVWIGFAASTILRFIVHIVDNWADKVEKDNHQTGNQLHVHVEAAPYVTGSETTYREAIENHDYLHYLVYPDEE